MTRPEKNAAATLLNLAAIDPSLVVQTKNGGVQAGIGGVTVVRMGKQSSIVCTITRTVQGYSVRTGVDVLMGIDR